jgi:hypothetical protein
MSTTSTHDSRTSLAAVPLLPGTIQAAPPGQKGFDTDAFQVTAADAAELIGLGYTFAIRYVSHEAVEHSRDLSSAEALVILDAGLALMPVQHVRIAGWVPTPALGTADGTHVSAHVAAIGFPPGVNVWLDLEGVDTLLTPTQAIIDYCNNWSTVITSAGYVPGLYVGANSGLNAQQLGQLDFVHYWKSESRVPTPTGFGFQMIQTHMIVDHGLKLDPDTTQNDQNGEAVFWLRK